MRNTFGNHITVTVFGESHGEAVGCVIDGICAGTEYDEKFMLEQLDKRKPKGSISTARKESDVPHILSGVYNGKFTGTPVTIVFENSNQHSADYAKTAGIARPSHADYVAYEKYHGANDPRGGGHFSGRLTAGIVAAGSIALSQLAKKGIVIGSHILQLDTIRDDEFTDYEKELEMLNTKWFAVLNEEAGQKMTKRIEQARMDRDSVGGILETVITGLPVGVGEPYFDSLESMLSHAVFSIGGVKGIEFGSGFAFATMPGSVANDTMHYENGTVVCDTNHNGGINGGISNGMPVVFKSVFKPTPSIFQPQNTIDYINRTDAVLNLEGRHDPCILHRARVVVDSMTAIVLWDLLTGMKGTDWWL